LTTVSVITPAFNAAEHIGFTIESVMEQDFRDLEHLVIDDCSTDGTVEVVRGYARGDGRLRLVQRGSNGGPGPTRNSGLAEATSRYVAFLDSDDVWMPGKLTAQLEHLRATGAGVSFTAFHRIDERGTASGATVGVPDSITYEELLRNTAIVTSTTLVDREITGDFRMLDTFYDDFALWLSLLRRRVSARGLNRDLLAYRVRPGSWSRNKLKSAYHVWRTYRDIERLPITRAVSSFVGYGMRGLAKYR
jgi:teichuronic acid biosynthesis glycosyltransferase TuaG